jgi:N6-L-threonylcarbamoyladenine synthase
MALILGIESSCDDTGVALFDDAKGILLAHSLFSQTELHEIYGGVVPELASRDHVQKITPLIYQCLKQANVTKTAIDAVAYTAGPGLNGALLVGAGVANGIAYSLNKPVIPIHHLEGHLLSPFLSGIKPHFPFLALLVSGGHTQFILVENIGKYTILGDSMDDAAGEAFDKTAKMLGYPYPGGKHIAKLAEHGLDTYNLPRPMLHSGDLNMSFSGLKTAVLTLLNKELHTYGKKVPRDLDLGTQQNIARSIEESITDVLVKKASLALVQTGIKTLVVSGGVGANLRLRTKLNQVVEKLQATVLYPPLEFCTDNGAMIALAGSLRFSHRQFDYSFKVYPRWPLNNIF